MTVDWTLALARRTKGHTIYVDDWSAAGSLVEKLAKVVDAVGWAHGATLQEHADEYLYEAYRNVCKLAAWMAGNTSSYLEDATRNAFEQGQDSMRHYIESLLAPILE